MNNKIKELALAAQAQADHLDSIGVDESNTDIFLQLFAKSIIKECVSTIDSECELIYEYMPTHIKQVVDNHFGIKE